MSDRTSRIISSSEQLLGIVDAWRSLWCRSATATPFQHPAWLLAWWRAFRPGALRTIAISQQDRLIGLAPLYLEPGGKLLPVGISVSDSIDFLCDPGREPETVAEIGRVLAEEIGEWLNLSLPDLPPHSLAARVRVGGHPACLQRGVVCPVLPIGGDDGLAHVPAIKRRKLRMSQHRLARAGGTRILTNPDLSSADWYGHLARLHTRRWNDKGGQGVLHDEVTGGFQRRAISAMMDAGLVRMLALDIEGQIAGIYYGFQHSGRAYAYLGGFDPDFAYYSPGTVLLGAALADACASGATELDLLRGGERYKYEWGAIDRLSETLWIERNRD